VEVDEGMLQMVMRRLIIMESLRRVSNFLYEQMSNVNRATKAFCISADSIDA